MQDKNSKEIKIGDYFKFPEYYGSGDVYGVVIGPGLKLIGSALVNYNGPLMVISFEFNINVCEKIEEEDIIILRLSGKL